MKTNSIITIGRQFGSGGREIGKKLAESLEIPFYDKELIQLAAKKSGVCEEVFETVDEQATNSFLYSLAMGAYTLSSTSSLITEMPINDKLFILQSDIIKNLAAEGPCVIVGRCGNYVLRDNPNAVHLFIYADMECKIKRVSKLYDLPENKVKDKIVKTDKKRANYCNYYTNEKWGIMQNYDFSLNSSRLDTDRCVEVIRQYLAAREAK